MTHQHYQALADFVVSLAFMVPEDKKVIRFGEQPFTILGHRRFLLFKFLDSPQSGGEIHSGGIKSRPLKSRRLKAASLDEGVCDVRHRCGRAVNANVLRRICYVAREAKLGIRLFDHGPEV